MNDRPGTSKQMFSYESNNNQPCTSRQALNNKSSNECEVKSTEYEKETIEYEFNSLLKKFIKCFVKNFEEELHVFTGINQSEEMNNGANDKILPIADVNRPKLKSANNNYIIENLRQLTFDELIELLINVSGDIFITFQNEIYRRSKNKNVKQLAFESVNRFLKYVNKRNEIEYCDINFDKLRCLVTEGCIVGGSEGETTKIEAENILILNGVLSNVRNIFDGARFSKIDNNKYKIETGYSLTCNEYGSALSENHELSDYDNKILNINHIEPETTLSNEKINHKLRKILYNINRSDLNKLKNDITEHLTNVIKEEFKKNSSQQKNHENKKSIWFNITPQVTNFTGRKEELKQIHELLQNKSNQKEVFIQATVISGIGGIGKSELSRQYIYEYKDTYPNAIWIDSESKENLKTSFQNLAQELEIQNITDTDIKIIVKKIYQLIGKSPSIIIFDNAEIYDDIKDYLPPSLPNDKEYEKPVILLTSRNNKWNVDKEDGEIQVMELEYFSCNESISYIKKTLNEDHSKEDMKKLAEELGHYPLALKQAIGYINVTNDKQIKRKLGPFRICDYLKEFLEEAKKIELLEYKSENSRYEQTIMTIWNVTFQKISKTENVDKKLQEISKNALQIIQLMSYLSPDIDDFIELFKLLISDENKLWESIELLQQYSLISVDTVKRTSTIHIHRLLQVAIKNRLKMNGEEIQILEDALLLMDSYDNLFYKNNSKFLYCLQQENLISVLIYGSNYGVIIEKFYKNVYLALRRPPLYIFAEINNIDAVKNIVKYIKANKPDELNDVINAVDITNKNILYIACGHCDLDTVKYLTENGANVNAVNNDKESILFAAVKKRNLDIVKYLIEKGININVDAKYNKSILHFAVSYSNLDIIKCLIENGANINALNNTNRNILFYAVECSNIDERYNDARKNDEDYDSILYAAVERNNFDIIKYLIEIGVNINEVDKYNQSILHEAVSNRNLDITKYLIQKGANINALDEDNESILHYAVKHNNLDAVKYLIEKGANINAVINDHESILFAAVKKRNLDIIKCLIENGSNIHALDHIKRNILFNAVQCSNIDARNNARNNNATKNAVIRYHEKIFYAAVQRNNFDIIKYLIEIGVNINEVDNTNTSILHEAVSNRNLDITKYLIENGANINAVDDDNQSILHYAVKHNNLDAVKYLIENGANVNSVDYKNRTVLRFAKKNKTLEYLISIGANINTDTNTDTDPEVYDEGI